MKPCFATQRFIRPLLLIIATVSAMIGVRVHPRAQEAKPASGAAQRPNLGTWRVPGGMLGEFDFSTPTVATYAGKSGISYADAFDYYAKKIGATGYDLKQLAEFQKPGHVLISGVTAPMNTSGNCYVDSETMHATFTQRTDHLFISIYLLKVKDRDTHVSMTATSF